MHELRDMNALALHEGLIFGSIQSRMNRPWSPACATRAVFSTTKCSALSSERRGSGHSDQLVLQRRLKTSSVLSFPFLLSVFFSLRLLLPPSSQIQKKHYLFLPFSSSDSPALASRSPPQQQIPIILGVLNTITRYAKTRQRGDFGSLGDPVITIALASLLLDTRIAARTR